MTVVTVSVALIQTSANAARQWIIMCIVINVSHGALVYNPANAGTELCLPKRNSQTDVNT